MGAAKASGMPTAISADAAAAARPDLRNVEFLGVEFDSVVSSGEVLISSTRPQRVLRARAPMPRQNRIVRPPRLIH